ncbi:MAG: GNAT family N-acetyltransferase [Oscillospiraceae bacterium]|nr:GNAT family N-acetyltransferase [Oscillospiraceae bacterium]
MDKLTLRERTAEHVRLYFEKTKDAQIRAMLPPGSATVEEALEKYALTQRAGADSYGRTVYLGERYIGDVWCYCMDRAEDPQAMLSYCLFEKDCWGKGLTTQAVKEFLKEVEARFGLTRIGAFTFLDNTPSIRVLEKNGFALVERFDEDGRRSGYYCKE